MECYKEKYQKLISEYSDLGMRLIDKNYKLMKIVEYLDSLNEDCEQCEVIKGEILNIIFERDKNKVD